MATWQEYYEAHLIGPREAAQLVRPGDRIIISSVCAEPQEFLTALVGRAQELTDVKIIHQRVLGPMMYSQPGMEKHFRHVALFASPQARTAIDDGRADFIPINISDIETEIRSGLLRADIAVLQTSKPDRMGYCSLGAYVGYAKEAVKAAKLVIGECNEQAPITAGDSFLHVTRFDYVIESSYPLLKLPGRIDVGPLERTIAARIRPLILDGATLQIGHGAIPNAVLEALADCHDLGIHSELMTDKMVDLMEAGVVTNRLKNVDVGKTVVSFLNGTDRMFEFVDRNPHVELHALSYVNSPATIARNDRVIAINSAIEVDLLGQVNAESVGTRIYSGAGGQLDFAIGARLSREGRYIVALPATARDGQVSRIVVGLSPGVPVTVPRTLADRVVTEYGIAELRGRTQWQRVEALIGIAAPEFREGLMTGARELGLLRRLSNI